MTESNMSEEELVREWHKQTQCPGTLTMQDPEGFQCSLDDLCPMMEEVIRLSAEGN